MYAEKSWQYQNGVAWQLNKGSPYLWNKLYVLCPASVCRIVWWDKIFLGWRSCVIFEGMGFKMFFIYRQQHAYKGHIIQWSWAFWFTSTTVGITWSILLVGRIFVMEIQEISVNGRLEQRQQKPFISHQSDQLDTCTFFCSPFRVSNSPSASDEATCVEKRSVQGMIIHVCRRIETDILTTTSLRSSASSNNAAVKEQRGLVNCQVSFSDQPMLWKGCTPIAHDLLLMGVVGHW